LADIVVNIKEEKILNFFTEVLQLIESRIDSRTANRSNLSQLLKELSKAELISTDDHRPFLEKAKEFFIKDLSWLDNVNSFIVFKALFPDIVSHEDREQVIKEFMTIAYDGLDYSPKDPDDYRNDANQIEVISEKLGIDMSDRIQELKDEADELEQSIEYPDIEQDYESMSGHSSGYCSDHDIESMFSILI
jgi:hypothetical protein